MVHLKYPSMERQDLTQAQLGSFKFTPIDEAAPSIPPHPLLLQQYHQSLQNAGFRHGFRSPDMTNNPSFFNQNIAPSLDTSRLRLGPAAMRAAVESASTSPQKRFSHSAHANMHPNAQAFHPQSVDAENESAQSVYTSEGNGMPLSLHNSETTSGSSFDHSINASVLRALESEQAAHEATKAQLENEINARNQAEAETMRLAECNKGLVNSINLLKSTVRHMVNKENDNIPDQASLDRAVKEYHEHVENKPPPDTIPYDVLSNYTTTTKTVKNGQETTSTFNLDLINTPDPDDKSEKAQLQRTLRRQMGLSESEHMKKLKDDYNYKIESIVRGTNAPLLPDFSETMTVETDSLSAPTKQSVLAPEPDATPTKPMAHTSPAQTGIMLELPASFMNKYGKKKTEDEKHNLPPIETPHKTNLTTRSAIKPRDYDLDSNRAVKPSKTIWMPDSPIINWKIDNRHKEELRGKTSFVETRTIDSHFLDYPLRYIPNVLDDNLYRTIMIDFIPYGTHYSDVLQQIRGGTLELIQMYGPIGDVTDFATARVVYTDENGATALYRRGQDPGIKINGKQVRVWQVLEATYPKNKSLEEAVHTHHHTRILIIHAPIDNIKDLLKEKLRSQIEAGLVLDIGVTHDGVPMVEFTSIEESTKALKAFIEDRDFAGADFDFEDDYCNSRFPDDVQSA